MIGPFIFWVLLKSFFFGNNGPISQTYRTINKNVMGVIRIYEAGRAVGLNQYKRGRNFCMLMDLW